MNYLLYLNYLKLISFLFRSIIESKASKNFHIKHVFEILTIAKISAVTHEINHTIYCPKRIQRKTMRKRYLQKVNTGWIFLLSPLVCSHRENGKLRLLRGRQGF